MCITSVAITPICFPHRKGTFRSALKNWGLTLSDPEFEALWGGLHRDVDDKLGKAEFRQLLMPLSDDAAPIVTGVGRHVHVAMWCAHSLYPPRTQEIMPDTLHSHKIRTYSPPPPPASPNLRPAQ